MGRRQTAGIAGGSGVGGVSFDNTTITAADNLDITIDPAGTGIFKVAGDAQIQAQGDLRFADSDSSNWVAFQAPATVTSNVTWTLPAADGTTGQVLSTNSSGTLGWVNNGTIVGNLIVPGALLVSAGVIDLLPPTSVTSTGQTITAFTEGNTTYSSITYTSVGGERKLTGFTATTSGSGIAARSVAITYLANGSIDAFTVT
jgi:hypothetical protein